MTRWATRLLQATRWANYYLGLGLFWWNTPEVGIFDECLFLSVNVHVVSFIELIEAYVFLVPNPLFLWLISPFYRHVENPGILEAKRSLLVVGKV